MPLRPCLALFSRRLVTHAKNLPRGRGVAEAMCQEVTAPVDLPATDPKVAGVIECVRDASPTAKFLSVKVSDKRFKFAAGQWIDFFAPGVEQIGGYSICSTPKQLEEKGVINLVVKRSRYPPAVWIHNDAKPGAEVELRVGGNFVITEEDFKRPILFVAGGIGITPLYSMMRHAVEQCESGLVMKLLYAARGKQEHCMVEEIREIEKMAAAKGSRVDVTLFDSSINPDVVGLQPAKSLGSRIGACLGRFKQASFNRAAHLCSADTEPSISGGSSVKRVDLPSKVAGRVERLHLKMAIASLEGLACPKPATAFLCGPPKMSDEMEAHLLALGMPKERIRLERWW
mmetsp:Transcript_29463/g.64370  ORF Transcript_29463/g.64370 Transcript_29463/m.64370 type:complete len:343 (-) Transcript_29463:697-1725(-)